MTCRHAHQFCAVAALLLAAQAQAVQQYKVFSLGGLEPGTASQFTVPWALNNAGMVVGSTPVDHQNTAFVYQYGKMSALRDAGGMGAPYAFDVNDRGQIVGEAGFPYLFDQGRFTDLSAPLGGRLRGGATGINGFGTAVGSIDEKAAIFENNEVRFIPISGAAGSNANSINERGTIVGNATFDTPSGQVGRGFVYEEGALSFLTYPDGKTPFLADRINNAGQILGYGELGAYIKDHDNYTKVPTLEGREGSVIGFNNKGWVVGGNPAMGGTVLHAYLYDGSRIADLNDVIHPGTRGQWILEQATDVNDRGWIVGQGELVGVGSQGFLAIPVPEPQTWVLMLAGLGGVVARAGRGRATARSARSPSPARWCRGSAAR